MLGWYWVGGLDKVLLVQSLFILKIRVGVWELQHAKVKGQLFHSPISSFTLFLNFMSLSL